MKERLLFPLQQMSDRQLTGIGRNLPDTVQADMSWLLR